MTASFKLITLPEAADALRVSRRTIERLVAAGKLRLRKIGRSSRISEAELAEYVNREATQGANR